MAEVVVAEAVAAKSGGGDGVAALSNAACTQWSRLNVSEQLTLAPEHDPLQRSNERSLAGVARSTTRVPDAKRAVHLAGQEMPAGVLVTVPPGSARTVSLKELGLGGAGEAVAVEAMDEPAVVAVPGDRSRRCCRHNRPREA